ncbi:hypothetical protein ANO11243_018890 [Dothideomycetidae sp. 11243]|nr:hypothetical protein ANO11243_018890 [fungal sp. No.11243]
MIPPNASASQPFTPLPSETTLYTSPARTSFSIASLGKFPAQQPFSLSASSGTLYLTTKRIIYLPATPSPLLQSFASPLLNLQDSHVTAPWIGPNVWTALARPVQGGNLQHHPAVEIKFTFRDGGAYDFQSRYERVRERLAQALEVARARGQDVGGRHDGAQHGSGRGPGVMEAVEVVMEDLPRYEDAGNTRRVEGDGSQVPTRQGSITQAVQEQGTDSAHNTGEAVGSPESPQPGIFTPPDEPPPGYEQVQREVIEDEFSRRLTATNLRRERRGESPSR